MSSFHTPLKLITPTNALTSVLKLSHITRINHSINHNQTGYGCATGYGYAIWSLVVVMVMANLIITNNWSQPVITSQFLSAQMVEVWSQLTITGPKKSKYSASGHVSKDRVFFGNISWIIL